MGAVEDMVKQIVEDVQKDVIDLKTKRLAAAGQYMKAKLKEGYVQQNMLGPPLNPITIKRKGHAKKLIDTGAMINSIDYVVSGGVLSVGSDYMEAEIGKPLVEIHEDGVKGASGWRIPPRPLIKAVIVQEEGYVEKILRGE